jgi:hypothetical protein
MNKAEEFLKQNDFPLGIDEEGNPIALSDDKILFNDIVSLLEQYAQQVAVKFAGHIADKVDDIHFSHTRMNDYFKEWINHQNQER